MTREPAETKGERTRKKLVDTTAELLRVQGYHATGLSQIVADSGAPRGSLYFYFPGGKDDLAIAALTASADAWRRHLLGALAGVGDPGAAIDALIGALGDELEASDWRHGCPVATVALESPSEPVRAMIAAHFEQWLVLCAELMVRFGIPREIASELALVAMSAIEGALLLCRVKRNREPLRAVGRALRAMAAPYVATAAAATTAATEPASGRKKLAKR